MSSPSTSSNDKGNFNTVLHLRMKHPFGEPGWFAGVLGTPYRWDVSSKSWKSESVNAENLGGLPPSHYLDERNHTRTFVSVSSNVTLDSSSRMVKADATSGTLTVSLPTAATFTGKLDVIKTDATLNPVVIVPYGTEEISGEAYQDMFGRLDCVTLVSDGSNWLIV